MGNNADANEDPEAHNEAERVYVLLANDRKRNRTIGSSRNFFLAWHLLCTMKELEEEIARIKGEIEEQKRLIKKNLGKKLVIETAEAEMKALHTRLSVLEANLAKLS